MLRTLSKAYGLAGLRVGFLVADPAVVDAVNACAIPFGVNAAAQAAALAALDQGAEVARRCAVVTAERTRVAQALRRRGLGVPASEANFWWLPAGDASGALGLALERRGVVTRPLGVGVRVTVGQPEDNDRFLAALDDAVVAEPALTAGWGTATGANAVAAADWLDRLDAAIGRFRDHLVVDHPGRTEPVPGEDETWDDRQVWAHVAEFGDYWLAQLAVLLDVAGGRARAVRPHPSRRRTHRRHRGGPAHRAGRAPRDDRAFRRSPRRAARRDDRRRLGACRPA